MCMGAVKIGAGYCACVRVLCARTCILRPRPHVAVNRSMWSEIDSLEKLTVSILSYFQKVPSVEVSEYNETGDSIPPAPKRPLNSKMSRCS